MINTTKNIPITGIYKIISPTGKIYIGQSIDIEKRWKAYKRLNIYSSAIIKVCRGIHSQTKGYTFRFM